MNSKLLLKPLLRHLATPLLAGLLVYQYKAELFVQVFGGVQAGSLFASDYWGAALLCPVMICQASLLPRCQTRV